MLSPPAYCAGKCTPPPSLSPPPRWRAPRRTPERRAAVCADAKWFDLLLERDAALREETETWRATGVGRHALKVYAATQQQQRAPSTAIELQGVGAGRAQLATSRVTGPVLAASSLEPKWIFPEILLEIRGGLSF